MDSHNPVKIQPPCNEYTAASKQKITVRHSIGEGMKRVCCRRHGCIGGWGTQISTASPTDEGDGADEQAQGGEHVSGNE